MLAIAGGGNRATAVNHPSVAAPAATTAKRLAISPQQNQKHKESILPSTGRILKGDMMNRAMIWMTCVVASTPALWAARCPAQVEGVLGAADRPANKVHEKIYQASGFGNTFMVLTDAGNVIIDTSLPDMAERHHKNLRKVSEAPTRYIIFTHAHEDHTSGAPLWKEPDTQVIAQRLFTEMREYQDRFGEFFARRNAAQFGFDEQRVLDAVRKPRPRVEPTILFDEQYEFELGGTKFELSHTPGETYDHLTVWLPQIKAAFVGDNFYASFPNMYTLRGTRPRGRSTTFIRSTKYCR